MGKRWVIAFALSCFAAEASAQSPFDLRAAAFAQDDDGPYLGRLAPAKDFDVDLGRAFAKSKNQEFVVLPHAGFRVSERGSQPQAGATVSLTPRTDKTVEQLRDLGVREGAAAFGDTGRWYLFAAASGRAIGMNLLKKEQGWDGGGLTTDPTGALVGDAQVGIGWRKGDMQSSFGVIHREVRGNHMIFGQETRTDTVAAFSFSIRPQK